MVQKTCLEQVPKIAESQKEVDPESSVSVETVLWQSGMLRVELQHDMSPDESSADKIHVSRSRQSV